METVSLSPTFGHVECECILNGFTDESRICKDISHIQ